MTITILLVLITTMNTLNWIYDTGLAYQAATVAISAVTTILAYKEYCNSKKR